NPMPWLAPVMSAVFPSRATSRRLAEVAGELFERHRTGVLGYLADAVLVAQHDAQFDSGDRVQAEVGQRGSRLLGELVGVNPDRAHEDLAQRGRVEHDLAGHGELLGHGVPPSGWGRSRSRR